MSELSQKANVTLVREANVKVFCTYLWKGSFNLSATLQGDVRSVYNKKTHLLQVNSNLET